MVLLLAMTPLGELRVSIPFGIGLHQMHWLLVFFLSVIGNMIPPLLIIGLFDRVPFLRNWKIFTHHPQKKQQWIQKYGWIGLVILVAIPLPGTGAWTGSLLAWILRLPKIPSLMMVFLGVCIAGALVTMASLGFIHLTSVPSP